MITTYLNNTAQTPHNHLLCSFGLMTFATLYNKCFNSQHHRNQSIVNRHSFSPANVWPMRPTMVNTSYFTLLDAEPWPLVEELCRSILGQMQGKTLACSLTAGCDTHRWRCSVYGCARVDHSTPPPHIPPPACMEITGDYYCWRFPILSGQVCVAY